MAWENRGNRRYCYESVRAGSRVVKRYLGPELVAFLIDAKIEEKKAKREAERAKFRAIVEELTRLEEVLTPFDDFARTVADGAMLAAGYHRPKRGPWRKRRVQIEGIGQAYATNSPRDGGETG